MQGLLLNEGEYVTYPFQIFEVLESCIRNLNWRVSNVECDGNSYQFPFEGVKDSILDGDELFELVKEHPNIQWIWGVLSGFPKEIPVEIIRQLPVMDKDRPGVLPYLVNGLHHLEPKAVLEIIAFDGTETHVLVDDEEAVKILKAVVPKTEKLELQ